MHKRILVIKACGSSDEPHECNGICELAQLYGIESVCKCVKDNEDLENILYSHGLFDYIYLSAHGISHVSNLFREIVKLYKEDSTEFAKLLEEAKHRYPNKMI